MSDQQRSEVESFTKQVDDTTSSLFKECEQNLSVASKGVKPPRENHMKSQIGSSFLNFSANSDDTGWIELKEYVNSFDLTDSANIKKISTKSINSSSRSSFSCSTPLMTRSRYDLNEHNKLFKKQLESVNFSAKSNHFKPSYQGMLLKKEKPVPNNQATVSSSTQKLTVTAPQPKPSLLMCRNRNQQQSVIMNASDDLTNFIKRSNSNGSCASSAGRSTNSSSNSSVSKAGNFINAKAGSNNLELKKSLISELLNIVSFAKSQHGKNDYGKKIDTIKQEAVDLNKKTIDLIEKDKLAR